MKYENINLGLYKIPLEYTSGCLTFSGGVSEGLVEEVIVFIYNRKNIFPHSIEKAINKILNITLCT